MYFSYTEDSAFMPQRWKQCAFPVACVGGKGGSGGFCVSQRLFRKCGAFCVAYVGGSGRDGELWEKYGGFCVVCAEDVPELRHLSLYSCGGWFETAVPAFLRHQRMESGSLAGD